MWDATWILNGLPLGMLLLAVPRAYIAGFIFASILAVQTAHTIAPIILAWSHDGFREIMLREKTKYIVTPTIVLLIPTLIGVFTTEKIAFNPETFSLAVIPKDLLGIRSPFVIAAVVYTIWNSYHFGKQAFGVMSIYRVKKSIHTVWAKNLTQRRIDLWYCCTVICAALSQPFVLSIGLGLHKLTGWPPAPRPFLAAVHIACFSGAMMLIVGMLVREWFGVRSLPRAIFILTDGLGLILVFNYGLMAFAIISLNHWFVAIGLASHVDANANCRSPWPFAMMVMGVGFVLFCVLFFDPAGVRTHGLSSAALSFTATAVGFRLGLGFCHFLYDRYLYQFSKPEIRRTIGADMLPPPRPLVIPPFPAIAAE